MSTTRSRALLTIAVVLVLGAVNWSIIAKERIKTQGERIFLALAPVDPRSLMQGDYMALRFKAADEAFGRDRGKQAEDGRIVVKVDERGVGAYRRRDAGEPLAAGEVALRYRVREGKAKFATNAFFFQEGTGQIYARARYGEFRVAPSGDLLLTHLRGEKLERLGPPRG